MGRSTDEVPILISIGYGVPRSTGRHTNLHTNYDLLVILLVKKMDDDNACGMPNRQPQPPASPAEGDRGSKRQRTGPIGAAQPYCTVALYIQIYAAS